MKSCAIAGGLLLLAVLLQARACPVLRRDVNCKDNYDFALSPTPVLLASHPESVSASHGSTISFNCSIATVPIVMNGVLHAFPILWRLNGSSGDYPTHWTIVEEPSASTLTVHNISHSDDGYYECMAGDGLNSIGQYTSITVSKRAWLNTPGYGNGGVAPVLGLEHRDIHRLEGLDQTHFIEECRVTGPNQTLYWYKDGVDITQYYNINTGILNYNLTIDFNLHGVYQCFVENEAGSDYVNFRALPRYFADPPSNFSCVAVDREDNYLLPSLLVSWEAPLLISGGLKDDHKYFVRVQNDCYNVGSSTCAVIELRQDDDVICSVFLDLDPLNDNIAGGVATVNGINTADQRRTSNPVLELRVNCSSSNVTVYLPSPELPFFVCVKEIHLWALCLHQGSTYRTSLDINRRFLCNGNPFTLDIAPQPLGSVCLFGGNYRNDIGQSVTVSSSSCSLPPAPLEGKLLSLSCSRNETSFIWHGNYSVNVSGTCYTPQLDQHLDPIQLTLDSMTVFPGYQLTNNSELLPLESVCMYTTSNNISAQCIVMSMVEEEPSTTSTPSTNITSTNITSTNITSPGYVLPVYTWVILFLVIPIIILVAVVMVVICIISWYPRYQQRKEKNQMHFLASVVEHQLDNPAYPPVDPFSSVLHGSSLSLHTQVDSLWEETKHEHDRPTSLMDKFLGESPPRLLIQEYLNSISSSGYATARTEEEDETEYYKQRLQDVSEISQDKTRFVREYFEPDLEGYVHMIPYSVR